MIISLLDNTTLDVAEELIQEAKTYVFVKTLPDGRISL